jgi:hypothetical protein
VGGTVSIAQPGIGDEKTSTLFSVTGFCNIAGAALTALNSRFNGKEFTISMWRKANGLGVVGRSIYIIVDAGNRVYFERLANDTSNVVYIAGGTSKNVNVGAVSNISFQHCVLTVSLSANQMKWYVNGTQAGTTQIGLGTWAGNLTDATIGAINNTAGIPYIGWIQHVAIWNIALTPGQIADLARYG